MTEVQIEVSDLIAEYDREITRLTGELVRQRAMHMSEVRDLRTQMGNLQQAVVSLQMGADSQVIDATPQDEPAEVTPIDTKSATTTKARARSSK